MSVNHCTSRGLVTILLYNIIFLMLPFSSCQKLIEIKSPSNQLESSSIYQDSASAQATVNGLYAVMYNTASSGTIISSVFGTFLTTCQARSSDELLMPKAIDDEFVNNNLLPNNSMVNNLWVELYRTIYQANKIIEGMQASALSSTLKSQLIGEAKFVRAFCYFHLINLWGPVPLVTVTSFDISSVQSRTPIEQVYAKIIEDLKDAQSGLSDNYSWSAGLRTRPNRWAAAAMLARVYLHTQNWSLAELEASKVINHSPLYSLPASLTNVFLKGSTETIWAFNTNHSGYPYLSLALMPPTLSGDPNLALTTSLLNAFERDANRADYEDDRYGAWTKESPGGLRYGYKYTSNSLTSNTEFAVVLRLAEQYLIRSEARIQLANLSGGISDLNIIRKRAGLHPIFVSGQSELLLAVEHERQTELFLEYGARWYDLKRTGRADQVLPIQKGPVWQPTDVLYPIPAAQLVTNPYLSQNAGYH